MPTSQRGRCASFASRPSLSVSLSASCSASCCWRTLLNAYENAASTAQAAAIPSRPTETSTAIGLVTTLPPGDGALTSSSTLRLPPGPSRSIVGAVLGRGGGLDLGSLEVGERADAESAVALGVALHERTALLVIARAVVALARGRVARDEHPSGRVGVVRLAVVRREPVDQHRVTRVELSGIPAEA